MPHEVTRYNELDPAVESRIEALLDRMTLAEKAGQLVQESAFAPVDWPEVMRQMKLAEARGEVFHFPHNLKPEFEEVVRAGAASVINSGDVKITNCLQRIAVEESRLGIPLLVGLDVIHGLRTIFPIPLAEASTWNPDLLEQASRVAAEEASAVGVNWIFAPMVDVSRDPRWGRIAEGAGEDSFFGMAMARARVRGFQSDRLQSARRIAACPKHYVGYGGAEGGRDYNTVDMSERTLREVYLPPFKAAFDAGAGSTMSAFNEIGGVAGTCNPFTLRTVLRDEWRWPGVVLSDFNAIGELIAHGVAADLKDAARLSILAGVDVDMESGAYGKHLADLVQEGTVPVEVLDEAVRRVLRLKFALGLFEQPYTDESLAERIILRDDSRALALEVARQSMVLLKNDKGLLPLKAHAGRMALIGPLARNRSDLLGTWAVTGQAADVETVVEGLGGYVSPDTITYVRGCPISGDNSVDIPAAVGAAGTADVVILVVGEGADMSGEAHSRAHLGLPGRQQELVDAVIAAGKPTVCVLMCGRPLVIPRLVEQVDALLVAWHGGIRAGRAVADLLFGAANPSGKLTASWPRTEGQIPVYYAHKNTGRPAEGSGTKQFYEPFRSTYMDEPNAPLFSFGFGLSYTSFEYSDLQIETPAIALDSTLVASALVKNSGERAGAEVVQLYVRDLVGSVTRPVKELKGFQRVELQPGEARRVRFEVPASDLGFIGLEMRYVVEPGAFQVWIGPDSTSGLEGDFEVRQ
jgi:beta-glucosidase